MVTIIRVYDTYEHARQVYDRLRQEGLGDAEVSLVGNAEICEKFDGASDGAAARAGVGATVGGSAGLLAGLGILAVPGIGPLVAGGWLAATLLGAAAGAAAGGLVGALTQAGIPESEARVYEETVRAGATMVVVKELDEATEARAQSIMDAGDPIDLIARADEFRRGGRKRSDPSWAADVRSDFVSRPPDI